MFRILDFYFPSVYMRIRLCFFVFWCVYGACIWYFPYLSRHRLMYVLWCEIPMSVGKMKWDWLLPTKTEHLSSKAHQMFRRHFYYFCCSICFYSSAFPLHFFPFNISALIPSLVSINFSFSAISIYRSRFFIFRFVIIYYFFLRFYFLFFFPIFLTIFIGFFHSLLFSIFFFSFGFPASVFCYISIPCVRSTTVRHLVSSNFSFSEIFIYLPHFFNYRFFVHSEPFLSFFLFVSFFIFLIFLLLLMGSLLSLHSL